MTKFFALGLVIFPVLPAPLQADTPLTEERIVVRSVDLDLTSSSGRRGLDRRLERAIVTVCGEAPDFDIAGASAVRQCQDNTRLVVSARRQRLIELASRPVLNDSTVAKR